MASKEMQHPTVSKMEMVRGMEKMGKHGKISEQRKFDIFYKINEAVNRRGPIDIRSVCVPDDLIQRLFTEITTARSPMDFRCGNLKHKIPECLALIELAKDLYHSHQIKTLSKVEEMTGDLIAAYAKEGINLMARAIFYKNHNESER